MPTLFQSCIALSRWREGSRRATTVGGSHCRGSCEGLSTTLGQESSRTTLPSSRRPELPCVPINPVDCLLPPRSLPVPSHPSACQLPEGLVLPILALRPERLVLVGDEQQLAPLVKSVRPGC